MEKSGKKLILLVDDDAGAIQSMKGMLRSMGFAVVAKTDWKQAFDAFRERSDQFDVAILDYLMENMSGFNLGARLLEVRSDLPVILLSGYLNRAVEAESKRAGFRCCLAKPLTRDEVKKALDTLL